MSRQKKRESVLGLVAISPKPYPAKKRGLTCASNRSITKDEQAVIEEFHRQITAMEALDIKAEFGIGCLSQLHQHTAWQYDQTVSYILDFKNEPRSREDQPYFEEFYKLQVPMYARHLLSAMDTTGTNINKEIERSPYPPAKPRGLLGKIFGL